MKSLIEKVLAKNAPYDRSIRAAHGDWDEAAKAVKALVSTGFPVTEACRRVLDELSKDFSHLNQLRCAYYNRYSRYKTNK